MTLTPDLLRKLAFHYGAMAEIMKVAAGGDTAPPKDDGGDAEPKRKPGRPPKAGKGDDTPAEDDKTITEDHPKRAELRKVANAYAEKTSREEAQKAMKLYGESSKVVPDEDLPQAIVHFKNLIAKLDKAGGDDI